MCSLNLSVFIDIQIRSKTDLKKKKNDFEEDIF